MTHGNGTEPTGRSGIRMPFHFRAGARRWSSTQTSERQSCLEAIISVHSRWVRLTTPGRGTVTNGPECGRTRPRLDALGTQWHTTRPAIEASRSEEHTSELQSQSNL